jgi:hypothetical protein
MRVAIVALGPSSYGWLRTAEGIGDWRLLYDEVWAINGFVSVIQCTRGFAMDDLRIQEARAKAGNAKIGNLLEAYKKHKGGPIYTSRAHPDYPLVEYPLEAVTNSLGHSYFNSTIAYAIALAIHEKATEIGMYGADYSWPDKHTAEKGRGCCEFWLGIASARDIKIGVHRSSTLMDANNPALYGYDTVNVIRENGRLRFEEKTAPSAEEIERRYFKG